MAKHLVNGRDAGQRRERRDRAAMPKAAIAGRASRPLVEPRPGDWLNVIEGQIQELCRDLAVAAKRLRQLQEQADELRTVIRVWAGPA